MSARRPLPVSDTLEQIESQRFVVANPNPLIRTVFLLDFFETWENALRDIGTNRDYLTNRKNFLSVCYDRMRHLLKVTDKTLTGREIFTVFDFPLTIKISERLWPGEVEERDFKNAFACMLTKMQRSYSSLDKDPKKSGSLMERLKRLCGVYSEVKEAVDIAFNVFIDNHKKITSAKRALPSVKYCTRCNYVIG